jgi:hypothetical protein
MVNLKLLAMAMIVGAESTSPVWFRLAPEDRVRALLALAVLIFLGFAFMAFVWWAGRWTRRYMNRSSRTRASSTPMPDDWADRPLVRDDPSSSEPKG